MKEATLLRNSVIQAEQRIKELQAALDNARADLVKHNASFIEDLEQSIALDTAGLDEKLAGLSNDIAAMRRRLANGKTVYQLLAGQSIQNIDNLINKLENNRDTLRKVQGKI